MILGFNTVRPKGKHRMKFTKMKERKTGSQDKKNVFLIFLYWDREKGNVGDGVCMGGEGVVCEWKKENTVGELGAVHVSTLSRTCTNT